MSEEEGKIILEKEDLDELVKLHQSAMKTPILFYGSSDTASDAWKVVKQKMDSLGNKYGYNPDRSAIDLKTGVVNEVVGCVDEEGEDLVRCCECAYVYKSAKCDRFRIKNVCRLISEEKKVSYLNNIR